jgi:hypothetical protein
LKEFSPFSMKRRCWDGKQHIYQQESPDLNFVLNAPHLFNDMAGASHITSSILITYRKAQDMASFAMRWPKSHAVLHKRFVS